MVVIPYLNHVRNGADIYSVMVMGWALETALILGQDDNPFLDWRDQIVSEEIISCSTGIYALNLL